MGVWETLKFGKDVDGKMVVMGLPRRGPTRTRGESEPRMASAGPRTRSEVVWEFAGAPRRRPPLNQAPTDAPRGRVLGDRGGWNVVKWVAVQVRRFAIEKGHSFF
jgi:hypothetical protein